MKTRKLKNRSKRHGSFGSQEGFTIIELMIVLAILSILTSIVVPSVQNYFQQARLSRAMADMKTAQKSVNLYWKEHQRVPTVEQLISVFYGGKDPQSFSGIAIVDMVNWVPLSEDEEDWYGGEGPRPDFKWVLITEDEGDFYPVAMFIYAIDDHPPQIVRPGECPLNHGMFMEHGQ